jgi:hypothetical protein
MKRTYIDTSVLIAAFRGDELALHRAMEVLDDPDRKLIVSDYLRLEVLPKPIFLNWLNEIKFMQEVLNNAAEDVPSSPYLTARALEFAAKYDIQPLDALHLGAAAMAVVDELITDELITMEKKTKPICQVQEIRVISLHQESG